MIEKFVEELARALGEWAYVLVGGLAFLETAFFVGLFAPGEFTITLGGVLAGQGTVSLTIMIGVVWFCALLGDTTSFFLGAKLGREFILKHGPRFRITEQRLEKVEGYFNRHGGKTILIGRFIGLVRAVAPFSAGASGMPFRRFLPYDILGTGLWGATFVLLGYFFWSSFHELVTVLGRGTLTFGIFVALVVAAVVLTRKLRDPAERRRLKLRLGALAQQTPLRQTGSVLRPLGRLLQPLWRPVSRVLIPQLRFFWQRLTPGELGLEFTSLLAVAAVCIYVVALYITLLSANPGPTPGDSVAIDVARGLRVGWHTDLLKVVTQLGSVWVIGAASIVAALLLLRKRCYIETVVLAGGLLSTWIAVGLLKAAVARPRPAGGLIAASGYSFPSGHAAFTVTYVAIAILLTRAGLGRWSATAMITAGVVATVAVGLTRLYLGVHYLSDITAGWALGLAVFSVWGMIGLVAGFIRNNRESPSASIKVPG